MSCYYSTDVRYCQTNPLYSKGKDCYTKYMELRDRIKSYYENNRITFADLARQSESLFGQKVEADTLRKWAERDGGWRKAAITNNDKMEIIANKLFNKIEEEGDDMSARDLAALANSYRDFMIKAGASAPDTYKPTLQQIIDAVDNDK